MPRNFLRINFVERYRVIGLAYRYKHENIYIYNEYKLVV